MEVKTLNEPQFKIGDVVYGVPCCSCPRVVEVEILGIYWCETPDGFLFTGYSGSAFNFGASDLDKWHVDELFEKEFIADLMCQRAVVEMDEFTDEDWQKMGRTSRTATPNSESAVPTSPMCATSCFSSVKTRGRSATATSNGSTTT